MSGGLLMSRRDRRTLIGGLLGMAGIVGAARAIPVWREWNNGARDSALQLTSDVAALETQLRHLPTLRDSARARGERAAKMRAQLIEAPTAGVAGADLATQVTDIADDLGVRVSAVQIRPDTLFKAGYARVGVTLTAAGDVEHLADLLHSLEGGDGVFAVRELTVTPADVLVADGRPETLRFQLMIEALAAKAGEPAPTAHAETAAGDVAARGPGR